MTEIKPKFGFKIMCEEQSVNFSVFDRKKLSFAIQINISTHEEPLAADRSGSVAWCDAKHSGAHCSSCK